jgi:diguanylate cyclase (GGDEF)-like protein
MKLMTYLSRRSKPTITVWGVGTAFGIGVLDYLSDPEISLSLFYMMPVFLITWFVNRRTGQAVAGLCSAVWLAVDIVLLSQTSLLVHAWNMLVRLLVFLVLVSLLAALQEALAHEQELARTDRLTEISNSRHFYEQAGLEIQRARRHRRPLTMAYLDIDNFKAVNDGLGHQAGDALLHVVAETLKKETRKTDVVARLGGDEFGILFPETRSGPAKTAVEKIQRSLLEATRHRGWPVTFSLGLVTFVLPPSTVDELIEKADRLMYDVKTAGKNQIKWTVLGESLANEPGGRGRR